MAQRKRALYGLRGPGNAPVDPEVGNQFFTMRLPDGREVAFVDWCDYPLFSTLDVLSGSTDSELFAFTYVVGDVVPSSNNVTTRRTATENDTNVSTPGAMASAEEMLVYAIRPVYFELDCGSAADATTALERLPYQPTPSLTNLARFQRHFKLELEIAQKVEHEAGFEYYNSGMGVQAQGGQSLSTGTTNRVNGSAGVPSQEAVRTFVIPQHIGGQEKYFVRLRNAASETLNFCQDPANTGAPVTDASLLMQCRIYLDGLYKRPVA
jgi:hypothetical protein